HRGIGQGAGKRERLALGLCRACDRASPDLRPALAGAAAETAAPAGGGLGMRMSLYIARRFAGSVGLVFLIFFGILLLIDMIEQMRKLSGTNAGLMDAFQLSLLNVPDTLYRI